VLLVVIKVLMVRAAALTVQLVSMLIGRVCLSVFRVRMAHTRRVWPVDCVWAVPPVSSTICNKPLCVPVAQLALIQVPVRRRRARCARWVLSLPHSHQWLAQHALSVQLLPRRDYRVVVSAQPALSPLNQVCQFALNVQRAQHSQLLVRALARSALPVSTLQPTPQLILYVSRARLVPSARHRLLRAVLRVRPAVIRAAPHRTAVNCAPPAQIRIRMALRAASPVLPVLSLRRPALLRVRTAPPVRIRVRRALLHVYRAALVPSQRAARPNRVALFVRLALPNRRRLQQAVLIA
jgi:hypothetical protein